jgi:hypothetical protein
MHSFKHNHLPNLLSSFVDNISQFQLSEGFRAWTSQWLHLIFSPAHFFCALQIFCLTSVWPTNPGPTIWSSKCITKWTKCVKTMKWEHKMWTNIPLTLGKPQKSCTHMIQVSMLTMNTYSGFKIVVVLLSFSGFWTSCLDSKMILV